MFRAAVLLPCKRKIGQALCIASGQEVFAVKVSVTQTTEVIGGREYPLTVTRQAGEQEIEVDGKPVQVTELTVFESPLGQSRCYTRARPGPDRSERAERRRQIQDIAAQAMLEQGIW